MTKDQLSARIAETSANVSISKAETEKPREEVGPSLQEILEFKANSKELRDDDKEADEHKEQKPQAATFVFDDGKQELTPAASGPDEEEEKTRHEKHVDSSLDKDVTKRHTADAEKESNKSGDIDSIPLDKALAKKTPCEFLAAQGMTTVGDFLRSPVSLVADAYMSWRESSGLKPLKNSSVANATVRKWRVLVQRHVANSAAPTMGEDANSNGDRTVMSNALTESERSFLATQGIKTVHELLTAETGYLVGQYSHWRNTLGLSPLGNNMEWSTVRNWKKNVRDGATKANVRVPQYRVQEKTKAEALHMPKGVLERVLNRSVRRFLATEGIQTAEDLLRVCPSSLVPSYVAWRRENGLRPLKNSNTEVTTIKTWKTKVRKEASNRGAASGVNSPPSDEENSVDFMSRLDKDFKEESESGGEDAAEDDTLSDPNPASANECGQSLGFDQLSPLSRKIILSELSKPAGIRLSVAAMKVAYKIEDSEQARELVDQVRAFAMLDLTIATRGKMMKEAPTHGSSPTRRTTNPRFGGKNDLCDDQVDEVQESGPTRFEKREPAKDDLVVDDDTEKGRSKPLKPLLLLETSLSDFALEFLATQCIHTVDDLLQTATSDLAPVYEAWRIEKGWNPLSRQSHAISKWKSIVRGAASRGSDTSHAKKRRRKRARTCSKIGAAFADDHSNDGLASEERQRKKNADLADNAETTQTPAARPVLGRALSVMVCEFLASQMIYTSEDLLTSDSAELASAFALWRSANDMPPLSCARHAISTWKRKVRNKVPVEKNSNEREQEEQVADDEEQTSSSLEHISSQTKGRSSANDRSMENVHRTEGNLPLREVLQSRACDFLESVNIHTVRDLFTAKDSDLADPYMIWREEMEGLPSMTMGRASARSQIKYWKGRVKAQAHAMGLGDLGDMVTAVQTTSINAPLTSVLNDDDSEFLSSQNILSTANLLDAGTTELSESYLDWRMSDFTRPPLDGLMSSRRLISQWKSKARKLLPVSHKSKTSARLFEGCTRPPDDILVQIDLAKVGKKATLAFLSSQGIDSATALLDADVKELAETYFAWRRDSGYPVHDIESARHRVRDWQSVVRRLAGELVASYTGDDNVCSNFGPPSKLNIAIDSANEGASSVAQEGVTAALPEQGTVGADAPTHSTVNSGASAQRGEDTRETSPTRSSSRSSCIQFSKNNTARLVPIPECGDVEESCLL